MKNPWLYNSYGRTIGPTCVHDRMDALKSFDMKKLRAVIRYSGTQESVRKQAERRLRRLQAAEGE